MANAPHKLGSIAEATSPSVTTKRKRSVALVAATPSIANLTDAEAMVFGRAAGEQAFTAAIDAGVVVSMAVSGKVVTVKRAAD